MDFVLDGCPLRRHFGCPMPENLFWAVSWCLQGNWGKAMDAATRERQLSVSKRRRWRREAATFDAHKRRRVELNGRGRCRLPRVSPSRLSFSITRYSGRADWKSKDFLIPVVSSPASSQEVVVVSGCFHVRSSVSPRCVAS